MPENPHGQNPNVTVVVAQNQHGGGGCLAGLGLGVGGAVGCVVVFLAVSFGGLYLMAKGCSSAAKSIQDAEAKRKEEDAKKYILVSWKVDNSVLQQNKFTEADKGRQHVGIFVEVESHGYGSVYISPTNFSLEVEGASYGRSFDRVNPKLQGATLEDGAKITGGLAFEVPDAAKKVVLKYDPGVLSEKNVRYGDLK